jgi:hypothetical protein
MLDRNPRNALLASLRRRYNVSLVSFIDHQELVTNGFDALGIYFNASREEVTNLEKYGFTKVWYEGLNFPLSPNTRR